MARFKPRNTERARSLRHAATPSERSLWKYLARSQLGAKFSRQMPVGPYFADFLCRELKLVVELDGHSHDLAPGKDRVRDGYMEGQGYRLLRFTNDQVANDIEAVVTAIQLELERLAHP